MFNRATAPMQSLDALNGNFQLVRNSLSKSPYAEGPRLAKVLAQKAENWQAMQAAIAEYGTQVESAEDRADLARLRDLVASYDAQVAQPLAGAAQAGKLAEAAAISFSPQVGTLTGELNQVIEHPDGTMRIVVTSKSRGYARNLRLARLAGRSH